MPLALVYAVDFSNGNLSPSLDTKGWGPMKQGDSGPQDNPESYADAKGLNLSVYRAPGSTSHAANGVHVVFGQGVLPLKTRFVMQVEFDRPNAHLQYVPQPSNTVPPPPPPGSPTPEPWAVGLTVKFGNEVPVDGEPLIAVTSQFNRQVNGVRLNTPFNEEKDQSPVLISPLDYTAHPQFVYQMEHSFCGIGAAAWRSIGNGSLVVGPPGTLQDQRVYSNLSLFGGQQTWIGALGVSLVTLSGTGQIMVRLRKFSVSMWS